MTPTPPDDRRPSTDELARLTGFLRSVVAPTTAVTALLFYFGWAHAYWFLDHFGVRSTVLDLSTRDYVMRSVDGLFVPVTVLALVVLALTWGRALVPGVATATDDLLDRPPVHRAIVVAGGLLMLLGLSALVVPTPLTRLLAVAPLSLVGGVLLLTWVLHRPGRVRRRSGAEWAAVAGLVFVGLFWFATDYAASVGGTRARQLVAELSTEPGVVVHSQERLTLSGAGVRELACAPGAAYAYRYDGLRLVIYSGGQFVLVPVGWTRREGSAVLLPRSETTLVEFTPRTSTAVPVTRC